MLGVLLPAVVLHVLSHSPQDLSLILAFGRESKFFSEPQCLGDLLHIAEVDVQLLGKGFGGRHRAHVIVGSIHPARVRSQEDRAEHVVSGALAFGHA